MHGTFLNRILENTHTSDGRLTAGIGSNYGKNQFFIQPVYNTSDTTQPQIFMAVLPGMSLFDPDIIINSN